MNTENNSTKHSVITAKLLAVLIAIIGLCLILLTLESMWQLFHKKEVYSHVNAVFLTITAFCGGYCIYIAVKSWFNISAALVRRICAIASLLLCSMFLGSSMLNMGTKPNDFQQHAWRMLIFLLGVIAGGAFYTLSSKVLIRWLALDESVGRHHKAILKQYFGCIAAIVWATISFWIISIIPSEIVHSLLIFSLLFVVFILYKLFCKYFIKPA